MSRIKCLIIDEPYASSVLESYIGELESLEHVGTFYHAIDGLMYLQQNKIDLLFLDIMLPKVTGEAFLELLPCRPRVIFLSDRKKRWRRRNDKYIIDCLVKPITFESFLASIDRYYAAVPQPVMKRGSPGRRRRPAPDRGPFIYLFSGRSVVKVFLDEVLYIEGVKQYTKIKTTEKELIVYQGLTAIEERIAGRGFEGASLADRGDQQSNGVYRAYNRDCEPHLTRERALPQASCAADPRGAEGRIAHFQ